jgi:hypothetical protein
MRPPNPEFPNRPLVCDIYAAQNLGFPIRDSDEFEIYRIALTSYSGITDPEAIAILAPLADRAREWLADHTASSTCSAV